MTEREQNINEMFVATIAFDAANSGDYTDLPDAEAQFAIVRAATAALEVNSAAQTSGAGSRAVEQKASIRAAIRRKLVRYSRTARGVES